MVLAMGSFVVNDTFVKLVGARDEVETQRPAFLQFCASLRRTP